MTHPTPVARAKHLAIPALIAALALTLSGCAAGPVIFGQGGPDPDSSASPYPGETSDEGTDGETSTGDEPNTGGEPALPAVGAIEVKLENAPNPVRIFRLDASECEVSTNRVWAVGVGAELTSGETAKLTVDTELGYVLHEATGTFHAKGAIVLDTSDGGVWTSDGRPSTIPGVNIPSMFDYRVKGLYAEFRTEWFEAEGAEGAGFVHIWCD